MQILPDVPRLASARSKMADCVFVLLLLCSRIFFLIGAVLGALVHGFVGFVLGMATGTLIGFWMHRSLGLRGRDLTHGYHFRMYERGLGERPRLLEALVEAARGNRLIVVQCRRIASAYAEAARQLQSCDSLEERVTIVAKRNRQVREIAFGERATADHEGPGAAVIHENKD
jgi:hypothetical protein